MEYCRRQMLHLHIPMATICTSLWENVVRGYSHTGGNNVKWQFRRRRKVILLLRCQTPLARTIVLPLNNVRKFDPGLSVKPHLQIC